MDSTWIDGATLLRDALWVLGSLGVVCGAAALCLRCLARFGPGASAKPSRRMVLLERLPLGPRRSLYLVQVEGRRLLVGGGEGAGLTCLADWEAASAEGQGPLSEDG